jgi:biotin/methionine sulfoxide reductase
LIQRENARDGLTLPDFDEFWLDGMLLLPEETSSPPLLQAFRSDPAVNPLSTPSGLIEIYSERIASFGYKNCPGHPVWLQPIEWLGAPTAKRTLHLLSNQPKTKLHSQLDHGINSRESKIQHREPIRMHPSDAASRGISDGAVVRVFNDRGACLAGARLSTEVMPGVVQLSTGAWYDPLVPGSPGSLDKHGNPNLLTEDRGTSNLAQGCSANSCLVEVELFVDDLPSITCYGAPDITQ